MGPDLTTDPDEATARAILEQINATRRAALEHEAREENEGGGRIPGIEETGVLLVTEALRRARQPIPAKDSTPYLRLTEAATDALIEGHKTEVQGTGLEATVTKHTIEHRDTYRDLARAVLEAARKHLAQGDPRGAHSSNP